MSCRALMLLGSGDEALLPRARAVLRMFCHEARQNFILLFLTGTSWDLNNAAVKQEHMGGPSGDSASSGVSHMSLTVQALLCFLCALRSSAVGTGKRRVWKLDRQITDLLLRLHIIWSGMFEQACCVW